METHIYESRLRINAWHATIRLEHHYSSIISNSKIILQLNTSIKQYTINKDPSFEGIFYQKLKCNKLQATNTILQTNTGYTHQYFDT